MYFIKCEDDETWEAMKKYETFIAALPDETRQAIENEAFSNSFATEVYDEYENDLERWRVAYETARCYADGEMELPK
jgi:hypothetical protein